jgi:hypothetical protein
MAIYTELDLAELASQQLMLIYIARRPSEAKALEQLLTERAVDYVVKPEEYLGE